MNPQQQNPEVQKLIAQLADINGLNKVNYWPLAIGWWIVLGVLAIVIAIIIFLILRRLAYRRSWKHKTVIQLNAMAERLNQNNGKEIMTELSILLRRLAINRFSRSGVAGLKGKVWAEWLTKNDLAKFDWSIYENLLTETPYAPPGNFSSTEEIKKLINATKKWVK